jgi:hypothetical protein
MLYLINRRNPTTYDGGQEPVLHLVSSVERIAASNTPFVFTNRHAYLRTCQFYSDVSQLDELDWSTIRSRTWSNTEEDPDRQERKMAEFLAHRFVPWSAIEGIGVYSRSYVEDVQAILASRGSSTPTQIKQGWYY